MRTSLKTTTAIVACLNLALPGPLRAQDDPNASGEGESVCVTAPASEACHDMIADGPDSSDEQGMDEAEIGDVPEPGAGVETDPDGELGADVSADPSATDPLQADTMPSGGDAAAPSETAPADAAPSTDEAATSDSGSDSQQTDGSAGDVLAPTSEEPATPESADVPMQDGSGASAASEDPAPAGAETSADTASETGSSSDSTSGTGMPQQAGNGDSDVAPTEPETATDSDQAEETRGQSPEDSAEDTSSPAAEPSAPEVAAGSQDAEQPEQQTAPATQTEQTPQNSGGGDSAVSGETSAGSSPASQAGVGNGASGEAGSGGQSSDGSSGAAASDNRSEAPASSADAQDDGESQPQPARARSADGAGSADAGSGGIAALNAEEGEAEAEEVVTETVTEESARSSSEDFATDIDQSPEASSGDDDGLSDLERALLLGAGALAVGAIMRGGREVVASSDDRVVVSGSDGGYQLIKDDNALLRQPGSEVSTQTFDDGSTRTVVLREDGSQIVTIRDPELRVVRRVRITPDGQEIVLINDTGDVAPVDTSSLQSTAGTQTFSSSMDEAALREALASQQQFGRSYSLNQIRSIERVRAQVPAVDLETVTFATGSAAISPEQADELTQLGRYISDRIADDPREIFLVEGHTDAVGDAAYNLALSDRRAESVALALSEYFGVPPENLVVQGYGEQFLKVETQTAEQANRRATLRRITPLLQAAAANP